MSSLLLQHVREHLGCASCVLQRMRHSVHDSCLYCVAGAGVHGSVHPCVSLLCACVRDSCLMAVPAREAHDSVIRCDFADMHEYALLMVLG